MLVVAQVRTPGALWWTHVHLTCSTAVFLALTLWKWRLLQCPTWPSLSQLHLARPYLLLLSEGAVRSLPLATCLNLGPKSRGLHGRAYMRESQGGGARAGVGGGGVGGMACHV